MSVAPRTGSTSVGRRRGGRRRWSPTRLAAARVVRRALVGLGALLLAGATTAPAAAHHVGTYTPRDNEVSANFKQLKVSLQARKFDVARQLYERGALRRELRKRAHDLPAGLEETIAMALRGQDAAGAERGLMVFFAALIRDLAVEAERRATDRAVPPAVRVAAGQKFLEAIWRYYNLIDFALSERDPRASTAVRLAFDEAEGYLKPGAAPAPGKLQQPLTRIARILTGVIETFSTPARRES